MTLERMNLKVERAIGAICADFLAGKITALDKALHELDEWKAGCLREIAGNTRWPKEEM